MRQDIHPPRDPGSTGGGEGLLLVQKAHCVAGVLPTAADLPCAIDDDDEVRRVRAEIDTLRRSALI